MSPAQPRFVRVTHEDAVQTEKAERDAQETHEAATTRLQNAHARQQAFAVVDPIAPAEKRWRAGIHVDERGSVRQTFSCNCGKHSHGHLTPDHPDGFASIIEPTRVEMAPPEWAKEFNARADSVVRERASTLAERVRAAITKPRTAAKTDRKRR